MPTFQEVECTEEIKYCAEVSDGSTPYGRYLGMVVQHQNGKWAATWNMCPNDEEAFYLDSREAAVAELRRKYKI
jgi:hypothetical protein